MFDYFYVTLIHFCYRNEISVPGGIALDPNFLQSSVPFRLENQVVAFPRCEAFNKEPEASFGQKSWQTDVGQGDVFENELRRWNRAATRYVPMVF